MNEISLDGKTWAPLVQARADKTKWIKGIMFGFNIATTLKWQLRTDENRNLQTHWFSIYNEKLIANSETIVNVTTIIIGPLKFVIGRLIETESDISPYDTPEKIRDL